MTSLTNPVILFFIFGIFAGLVKSNLEIPSQISKFLSLYLLMALGYKGGHALAESGISTDVGVVIAIALILAFGIPLIAYQIVRRWLNGYDAAAVAATYGSISAVTFITANQFLTNAGIEFSGYMSAVVTFMESPAIIAAVFLANKLRDSGTSIRFTLRKSLTEGSNLILLGALAVGIVSGTAYYSSMKPFTGDLFTGLLGFFLLDMGIQVAKNIPELGSKSPALLAYALIAPVIHSLVALGLCSAFGVGLGNTVLLMVLAASASYIAVPAAMREAIPLANPGVYLGLSLGITFPFNILIGIPFYTEIAVRLNA
jgi:uncharacterized protein